MNAELVVLLVRRRVGAWLHIKSAAASLSCIDWQIAVSLTLPVQLLTMTCGASDTCRHMQRRNLVRAVQVPLHCFERRTL